MIINSVRLGEGSIVKYATLEEESTTNDTYLVTVDPVNTQQNQTNGKLPTLMDADNAGCGKCKLELQVNEADPEDKHDVFCPRSRKKGPEAIHDTNQPSEERSSIIMEVNPTKEADELGRRVNLASQKYAGTHSIPPAIVNWIEGMVRPPYWRYSSGIDASVKCGLTEDIKNIEESKKRQPGNNFMRNLELASVVLGIHGTK